MKVKVTVTVDVDTKEYLFQYGEAVERAVIKEVIEYSIATALLDGNIAFSSGVIKNVEVK